MSNLNINAKRTDKIKRYALTLVLFLQFNYIMGSNSILYFFVSDEFEEGRALYERRMAEEYVTFTHRSSTTAVVSKHFFISPLGGELVSGDSIEILYDPSNTNIFFPKENLLFRAITVIFLQLFLMFLISYVILFTIEKVIPLVREVLKEGREVR